MSSSSPPTFKHQLIQLQAEFTQYTRSQKSKGMPIQHLVILMQKYLKIRPSSLQALMSRTIANDEVTWQQLLSYIEQEICLEDQVNKMRASKPSVIDIDFRENYDEHLGQRIGDVLAYIKKKSTNYIKNITKAEFLGFKLLVVMLEREAIFYDCEEKRIIRHVFFRYNNVRSKMMSNVHSREKSHDQYNASFLQAHKSTDNPGLKSPALRREHNEQLDKVPPMSRRTEEQAHSFSLKSHKNTNQSQQLKNMLTNNMKNSKVGSSASADEQPPNYESIKRSVTMMDYNMRNTILRESSKVHKFGSLQNNSIKVKDRDKEKEKGKKEMLKIRSSDTANILKLITDCKIQGSMEVIKAYRNSIETFQKYVQIDKSKLEREKDLLEEYKQPSGINLRFDYKKEIKKMKETSKELSLKKSLDTSFFSSHKPASYGSKYRTRTQASPKHDNPDQPSHPNGDNPSTNAFLGLQKRILQIQSMSFCQNYMLISLMNCELRLYSFKRTIHGFSEQLIFEKSYHSLVTDVLLYRSAVRKLFNICVVLSRMNGQAVGGVGGHKEERDLRRTAYIPPKHKETEIYVYELSAAMAIEKQSYSTSLSYSPIIVNMLPLGLGGYLQSGNFFLLQLNSTSTPKSQTKSIDTILSHPETSQRASISSMRVHRNLINLYLGCKDGELYIFDRLIDRVRARNRIASCQIVELIFVGERDQLLFWDASGKVGVVNAGTLAVENVVSLLGAVARGIGGNGNGSGFWGMMDFFGENQFLVYGDRTIGLVSLFENAQKKFNAQKPLKIYNRRLSIKNRTKVDPTPIPIPSLSTQKVTTKKIHKHFWTPISLILICASGQLMIFDKHSNYIGSYFTLSFPTITQCLACPSLKYLYLLHENNDMQVSNIYTQEQLLSLSNIKEEVEDIFFCHSSVYFCGYLSVRYQMFVYGYGDGRAVGYVGVLVRVDLGELVLGTSISEIRDRDRERERQREGDSKFSKASNLSLSTNSLHVQMDIKFHKGNMILIKKHPAQLIFLYKKTYSRNCVIRCQQHLLKHSPTSSEPATIVHTFIDLQSNLLTVLFSTSVVMLVGLDGKSVRGVCGLTGQGLGMGMGPVEHYYESSTRMLAVLYRQGDQGEAYCYCLYSLDENQQTGKWTATLLHSIDREPTQTEQLKQRPQKSKLRKLSTLSDTIKPERTPLPQSKDAWTGCPFLIGKDIVLLSKDHNHCNVYKVKANEQKNEAAGSDGKNPMQYYTEYCKIDVQ